MRRWLVMIGAVACSLSLPPLADGPRLVRVQGGAWADLEDSGALLPMDLDRLPDGSLGVLDGHRGRLLRLDDSGAVVGEIVGEGLEGAVRLDVAADGAGFWVAAPDAGALRRLDARGGLVRSLAVPGVVDVHDAGDSLVVGLRTGGVAWLDPDTGEARHTRAVDVDDIDLGTIAAVSEGPEGQVLVADTLGHRIHRMGADGQALDAIGRFGLWIGTLSKPKGVALGPGGVRVVADSALRAVQLFDSEGNALGALALEDVPASFEHPVQVLVEGASVWVLDAGAPRVHRFELSDAALATARERVGLRHLRHPLVDPASTKKAAGEARLCLQCHDGVVNDHREVWDPRLEHHPVGVVPEGDIPAFFPTDTDGALRCGTCHSPHGLADLGAVSDVDVPDARADLVRHRAPESDLFTRLSRDDAQLCRGCHQDAAHDRVLERLGLDGAVHPVGPQLAQALAARGDSGEAAADGSCLTCHAPHAAARAPLARSADASAPCLACHEDAAGTHSHPLGGTRPGPRQGSVLPVDDGVSCVTCHALVAGDAGALLRDPGGGRDLCTACHAAGPRSGPHAGVQGRCQACHAPHQAAQADALLVQAGTALDPLGCQSCHPGVAGHGHPIGPGSATPAKDAPACTDCHAAHEPVPTQRACGDCHAGPAAAAARGGHGGADCTACHAPHADPPAPSVQANPASQACLRCHGPRGQATRIAAWTHEAPVFGGDGPRWEALAGLDLAGPEGGSVSAGASGELVCTTCHTVHGPHAEQPADPLRRPGLDQACSSCHGPDTRVRIERFHERRPGGAP